MDSGEEAQTDAGNRPDIAGVNRRGLFAAAGALAAGGTVTALATGCGVGFTADPGARPLLDLSPMDAVGYDEERRAFEVQPGATLGHVYRALAWSSGPGTSG